MALRPNAHIMKIKCVQWKKHIGDSPRIATQTVTEDLRHEMYLACVVYDEQ